MSIDAEFGRNERMVWKFFHSLGWMKEFRNTKG